MSYAIHGGTEPDLLDEVAWWQTDDFWQYALFAAVAYIRAAAKRASVPVRLACQQSAQRPSSPRHNYHFWRAVDGGRRIAITTPNGGSARSYQAIFVRLTAPLVPATTGNQPVY